MLLPLFFLFHPAGAQTRTDSTVIIGNNRIVHQGRIYRQNAPYVTLGYGMGYNLGKGSAEQNMMVSYHHFIKGIGLFGGYHSSSDEKIWWRSYQKLTDLYLGVGKRWETIRLNASIFGGPSLAYGSYTGSHPDHGKDWAWGFMQPGLVLEGQLSYRLLYDVGLGLSFYGSLNRYYQVAGAQVHLFFSTAYVRNYE